MKPADNPARRPIDLDALTLAHGKHLQSDQQGCVMEWASYVAGEPWSDHPACVCPTLAAFCRRLNDWLPKADRQRLKPFVIRALNTATGPDDALARRALIADWTLRQAIPPYLAAAGMEGDAAAIAAGPVVTAAGVPPDLVARYAAAGDRLPPGVLASGVAALAAFDAAVMTVDQIPGWHADLRFVRWFRGTPDARPGYLFRRVYGHLRTLGKAAPLDADTLDSVLRLLDRLCVVGE